MTQVSYRPIHGYAFGAIQSSALFSFNMTGNGPSDIQYALEKLAADLPLISAEDAIDFSLSKASVNTKAALIVRLVDHINTSCNDRRFTPITAIEDNNKLEFFIPTLAPLLVVETLKALMAFIRKNDKDLTQNHFETFIDERTQLAARHLPSGTNTENFLTTAAKFNLPFKTLSRQNVIYGYGSGSTIFKSSMSDRESLIGVSLASDKTQTNAFLSSINLPVAQQAMVPNENVAQQAAEKIGYPVVLKPLDEEQGRGVVMNIRNAEELRQGFQRTFRTYKKLVLEKQIEGELHRINTFDFTYVRMVRRVPARIVGDGQRTLQDLIDEFNKHPLRNNPQSYTKPIPIDDELRSHLARHGFDFSTVPPAGKSVQLTPIWKSSRGGHSIDMTDKLHPENIKLCERVARSLRLRVTGIDLLSPDATVPWYENGAVICEVNAKPQIGITHPDMYRQILAQNVGDPPKIHLDITQDGATDKSGLFDPAETHVMLRLKASDIVRNGCPTQYFTSCAIAEDVPPKTREILEKMLVSVEPLPLERTA